MADNDKQDLKAQFIAAAKVSDDGNTITVGDYTAKKQQSGFLARLFDISTWEISAQKKIEFGNGGFTSWSHDESVTGFYTRSKIVNKLATLQVEKPPRF